MPIDPTLLKPPSKPGLPLCRTRQWKGALFLLLLLTSATALGAAPPRFWVWQPPLGAAHRSGPFVEMVRTMVTPDAEATADRICRIIKRRQLRSAEIAIVLQNFGVGDGDPTRRRDDLPALFNHQLDGLPSTASGPDGQPLRVWWRTPWMQNGIAEMSPWMERFVRRYRANQRLDPTLPDPARFHFDSEESPTAARKGTIRIFLAMQQDPRYDREPIPGFDGQTLKTLYERGGSPTLNPERKFNHPTNRAFINWYGGLCRRASDAAMNDAAYQLIRRTWPACQSSNYGTSERFDGIDGRFRRNARHSWLATTARPSADLSAPVLYFAARLAANGVTLADASVRFAAQTLDGCVLSYGGPHNDVVPWTFPVGYEVDGYLADEHLVARMFGLLRSRGVEEAILWSDLTTQEAPDSWNATSRVVSEVWSMSPRRLSVQAGGLQITEGHRLLRAHDGGATITSAPAPRDSSPPSADPGSPPAKDLDSDSDSDSDSADQHIATVTIHFRSTLTRWADDRQLRLIIGGSLDAGTPVTVEVRLRDQRDQSLRSLTTLPCAPNLIDTSLIPGPGVLAADHSVELQLHFTSAEPFSMNLDWLQAFPVAAERNAPRPPRVHRPILPRPVPAPRAEPI